MSTFKLQQFAIEQSVNAMKVCTDSLIFGALTPVENAERVLDIGGGTGILSLMAAQRGAKHITCVELMAASSQEASDNVSNSPWSARISVINSDINNFESDELFDVIISNPPFFDNHLKNDDSLRNTARHTDTLSYQQLLIKAKTLLSDDGLISLLLPVHTIDAISEICHTLQLVITKRCDLITMRGGVAKVTVLEIRNLADGICAQMPAVNTITVYNAHQQYSEQSARLLKNFLLRFA
ncbi:MAG: tRNA1(Val) (adenine(37)-N6)-methyltransferase [Psychrobium sp.]